LRNGQEGNQLPKIDHQLCHLDDRGVFTIAGFSRPLYLEDILRPLGDFARKILAQERSQGG
jgi:hypothetical protein